MEFILGRRNFKVFNFSMQYQNDDLLNIVLFLNFEFGYHGRLLRVANIDELIRLYNPVW
jgi:hypothetical protein